MNKRLLFILASILLLSGFLRFYRLDKFPPSLNWDEVSTGYDAYSILKTGNDQFKQFLPLSFRSLDDYKPPLYTYFTVISEAVLGYSDFSVRLPSAFFGLLAVISTYGLISLLFNNKKIGLLTAFFLAISPWHLHLSRIAIETNATIFFTTAALWAFIKGFKSGYYLILSSLLFGLDLFIYHSTRIFIPLLLLVIIILYFKNLIAIRKKFLIISAAVFLIFFMGMVGILSTKAGQFRFQGTSVFTPVETLNLHGLKQNYETWKLDDTKENMFFTGKLFHGEKVMFGQLILKNYLTHFSPNFWFFTEGQPHTFVEGVGLLYLVDILFVFSGLYFLLNKRNRVTLIFFVWLLLAPLAASVTRTVPHSFRSELMVIPLLVSIALAILSIKNDLSSYHKHIYWFLFFLLIAGYTVNNFYFLHQYYFHYPVDRSDIWEYGRREAAFYADSKKNNYRKIIVSTNLEYPHIFFLYYLKYNPALYQKEGGTIAGGWGADDNHFDKYYFKKIDFDAMTDEQTLFIGRPNEFPTGSKILKKIYYLNGQEAIDIVEGRKKT